MLSGSVDVVMSHDWPSGIQSMEMKQGLLRCKPFFADDIAHGALGSPASMDLLKLLQPRFWFSAHLHVRFDANVPHFVARGPPQKKSHGWPIQSHSLPSSRQVRRRQVVSRSHRH